MLKHTGIDQNFLYKLWSMENKANHEQMGPHGTKASSQQRKQ